MLEQSTNNPNIIGKAIAVVRKMSADEKLLYEIEKREETLREERSALSFAEEKGKQKRDAELIEKWKSKGYTDEQIKELLS